jgi:hypothetical protein
VTQQRLGTLSGAPNGARPAGSVNGSNPLPLKPRRPSGVMALLVAFVIAGAAIGYYLWVSAGSKTAVVFASRDIAIGHTITRDDLSIVNVSGGVVAVAGGNLSSLLGQHAAVKILADTPVQRAMVTTGSTLSAGEVLVGVAAAPGDKVQVLQLTQKGSIQPSTGTASTQTVLVPSAVVYDVRPNPTSAGGTLLTVVVPSGGAFGVAQASNSGLIALVRVG